ncbi:hypothetical protein ABZ436_22695 [Micromonospora matsumotoense]|uniref:hypothetical protein n=1 Tax=Micromonospora matsumotoense TaxID=121616 RepID=UPI0033E342C7
MTGTVDLHDVPDRLVPREPRLGGCCVPVPDRRLTALTSSGPVLLGRHGGRSTTEFTASVVAELRHLLRVPARYHCAVLPTPPGTVQRAVALEDWAAGLTVRGEGDAAARWRSAVVARQGWPAVAARVDAPAVEAVGVVLRETSDPHVPVDGRTPDRWLAVDLSRTSAPLTQSGVDRLDVGFLCPSWLFGVPPGGTVLVLSERAVAAARLRHERLGDAGHFLPTLHALISTDGTAGMTDLILLAHAVRARVEAEPGSFEAAVQQRYALVAQWAAARAWADCAPRQAGGDLTAQIRTTLDPGVLRRIDAHLTGHHLGYDVVDDPGTGCLRLGLGDTVPVAEIERLLGLLDLLVHRLTAGRLS